MRKLFLSALAFAAMASAVTLTSCSDDDNGDGGNGGGNGGGGQAGQTVQLGGRLTESLTLDASNQYILSGALIVPEGMTLTIPAGTTVRAQQGFGNYVLVERGGKIMANGTADKPVVFTANSDNATSGFWGGLIINGRAPISGAAAGTEGLTEINNDYRYGGTDAADNSGVLSYVELHYTGARNTADIEHNGLTLNAVGSGTTISNICIANGADDAIEFFGGSVNVSNLLAVDCDDDMFDFTQGYTGTLSNCYGRWTASFTSTEEDPRGVEADGNLDGNGPDHIGQSDFRIENMTIVNNASAQAMQDAIKIRRGATAHITNALVSGSGEIQNVIDLTDGKGGAGSATEISLTVAAANVSDSQVKADGQYDGVRIESGRTGCPTGIFGWTGYEFAGGSETPVQKEENLPTLITGDLTLDPAVQYYIDGPVVVAEGGRLTIPAGMTVKARQGFGSYLLVERGGQIFAQGTAEAPVTFTADNPTATRGYWGGLIINGRAPISGATAGTEGLTEINNDYRYGGTNAADNSGTLTYVRILYSGARNTADIEHNGLTLNAVGSGTTISNICIANGADDAIEFFGGSVNVSNLLAVDCDDDMFDFTQGYTGTLSNCYGRWTASFTSTEEDPRGVEADGNLDGNGPDHIGQSDFRIENMTIVNNASAQAMQDAIKIRRGATAHITNALVSGSGEIQNVIDLTDGKGGAGSATEISLTVAAANVSDSQVKADGQYDGVRIESGRTGCPTDIFGWTGIAL